MDPDIVSSCYYGADGMEFGELPSATGDLKPGVSVVICTYRRPQSVVRFVESLRQQRPRAKQLIIVDSSDDNSTEESIRKMAKAGGIADVVEYCRVRGKYRGLTRQRNFGVRS